MEPGEILGMLAIGAVAGWLAGKFTKGKGFGLFGDIVVGILGAVIGGFVFDLVGLDATGIVGRIVVATVGAVLLLAMVRMIILRKV